MIPFDKDNRPEAVKRREKWITFDKLKCAGMLWSDHFADSDYVQIYSSIVEGNNRFQPCLKWDEIGITAVPRFDRRKGTEQIQQKPVNGGIF